MVCWHCCSEKDNLCFIIWNYDHPEDSPEIYGRSMIYCEGCCNKYPRVTLKIPMNEFNRKTLELIYEARLTGNPPEALLDMSDPLYDYLGVDKEYLRSLNALWDRSERVDAFKRKYAVKAKT